MAVEQVQSCDVQYGVDPASVAVVPDAAPAPVSGSVVLLDGARYKVIYVTSKGMLDLKSSDGDVQYGVDPASVTVVGEEAEAAAPAAPPAVFDPSGLLGTAITVWDCGVGRAATIVESSPDLFKTNYHGL